MKQLITFTLCLFAYSALAIDTLSYNQVNAAFNKASFPYLDNQVESAIPGRCIHKFNPEKIKPSVMLVSLGEKGYEVAPIMLSNQPEDFFDNMSWKDVFNAYPEVNAQFFAVIGNGSGKGVGLYKKELLGESTAEIREDNNLFIIKAFYNNRFFRYCYYQKMN